MQAATCVPQESIKILLIYHDALLRVGLLTTLSRQTQFEVTVNTAEDGTVDMERLALDAADVIVTDYETGLRINQHLRSATTSNGKKVAKVLIVTWRQREAEIRAALMQGVNGYLLMGCRLDELIDGTMLVHRGFRHFGASAAQRLAESLTHDTLTGREAEVLQLVARGLPNKSVAKQLDIALGTVKVHVNSILAKLDAGSRTEATAVAQRRGLLNEDPDVSGFDQLGGSFMGSHRTFRPRLASPLHAAVASS